MQFWKMHGSGNDYIVVDNRNEKISGKHAKALAKKLCERRFSIGADGLLLCSNSRVADAKMRIFNADGSEAEMCGNGIRCFAKYCYENNIVEKQDFMVETLSGIKHVWLSLNGNEVETVKVDMGTPNWQRSSVPMIGQGTCINEDLKVDDETFKVTCLSMGNPHCIIFVNCIDCFPVEKIGAKIEKHKAFPNRTNVGFAEVLSRSELNLRVWERGCGETLACGTGTCAAVAASNKLGLVGSNVTVHVLGGELNVEVAETIFLTGRTEKVFEGTLFGER
jgi:diaminopimelate epimerase